MVGLAGGVLIKLDLVCPTRHTIQPLKTTTTTNAVGIYKSCFQQSTEEYNILPTVQEKRVERTCNHINLHLHFKNLKGSSKEIQPVHPKGDQSWVFTGRTDVEAEAPILWPPDAKS